MCSIITIWRRKKEKEPWLYKGTKLVEKINHQWYEKILLLLCLCLFIEEVASRELDKTFQLLPTTTIHRTDFWKGINYWELSYILSSDTTSIPILGDMLNKLPRCPRKGKPIRLNSPANMFLLLRKDMMEINEKEPVYQPEPWQVSSTVAKL